MKKKLMVVIFCSLTLVIFVTTIYAAQAPNNFNGIKYGANIKNLSGFTLKIRNGNVSIYNREDDENNFKGVRLRNPIWYIFNDDKFAGVFLTAGANDFDAMLLYLEKTYGQANDVYKPQSREYAWMLDSHLGINLSYDKNGWSVFHITYMDMKYAKNMNMRGML